MRRVWLTDPGDYFASYDEGRVRFVCGLFRGLVSGRKMPRRLNDVTPDFMSGIHNQIPLLAAWIPGSEPGSTVVLEGPSIRLETLHFRGFGAVGR